MKKYLVLCVVAGLCFVSKQVQAQETVVYACTRRASQGETETYIARLKNGVPVCNNKKHIGPFVLIDASLLGTAGAQGPQGPQGPQGVAGADGKSGETGPSGVPGAPGAKGPQGMDGAVVSGTVQTCVQYYGEGDDGSRQVFCTLNGTSFLYRTLYNDADQVDRAFSLQHVPDGSYTLTCDTESFCRSNRYWSATVPVTVANGEAVNVGTLNLCLSCEEINE